MKLFLQKNAKFSSAGGSAPKPPDPPNSPPHFEFLATRLVVVGVKISQLFTCFFDWFKILESFQTKKPCVCLPQLHHILH